MKWYIVWATESDGSLTPYYQETETAQQAVDNVRNLFENGETIDSVFIEDTSWK